MEKRIVQLNETEYDELKEKASVIDSQIQELAEKYYQERGVCEIIITQQFKEYDGVYRRYRVDSICFENGLSKQHEFKPIISEENRKRINSLAEKLFCVVMLGLTNVNILYYSFSTLYQMCNLRYNHIRVCDFFP